MRQGHRRLGGRTSRDRVAAVIVENLECRRLLAAAGLITTPAVPSGTLDGKIVFTSPGHGWQWNTTLDRYATDRGDNNEIVEDFGNQDQMTFYADYLLRAARRSCRCGPSAGRSTKSCWTTIRRA